MKIDAAQINSDLQLVSTAMPILGAAYAAYRAIWLATNPGKTEDDYVSHLGDVSKANVSAADAILIADGYVLDGGNWHKPASS